MRQTCSAKREQTLQSCRRQDVAASKPNHTVSMDGGMWVNVALLILLASRFRSALQFQQVGAITTMTLHQKRGCKVSLAVAGKERRCATAKIKSTSKTRNLQIPVPASSSADKGNTAPLDVDQMESALTEVGMKMGLYISHITKLGSKRYPGNRHWHLKRDPKENGCLDITYWPQGLALWVSIRNYEPAWVHDAGEQIVPELEEYLKNNMK
jgi:hypothetical protein